MAKEAGEILSLEDSDDGIDLNESGPIDSDVDEEKEIAEIIAAAGGEGNVSKADNKRSGMALEVEMSSRSRSTKPIFQLSRRYENPSRDFVVGFDTTTKENFAKKQERARRFGLKENFVIGFDTTTKENFEKKQERARRFGLKEKILPSLEDSALKELYASLGMHDVEKEKCSVSERGMRCEAIHVRGVNDMSTEDVLNYFSQFSPGYIEWIDDRSCNVVWMDAFTAASAMLALSYDPFAKKEKKIEKEKVQKKSNVEERMKATLSQDGQTGKAKLIEESDDDLDLMSEGEVEGEKKKDVETGEVQAEKLNDDNKMETEAKQDDIKSEGECSTDDEEEKVPGEMPPGRWRVGNTPNAKYQLYLRFATKADKELPGAERHSNYYQRYGNPYFRGTVGLISGSCKRRLKAEERRREEEEARAVVVAGGRTISPMVVEGEDPFDLHASELVEKFGVAPKEKMTPIEIEEKLSEYKNQWAMDQDSYDETRKRRRHVSERIVWPQRGYLSDLYEEGECNEDAAEFDEEALQMEAELRVLMEQTPDLVAEEVQNRSKREAMKMHADEEEKQIVLRQQQAKHITAIQAIHEFDNQLKHVKDGNMDTGTKIKQESSMAQENVIPQKAIVDSEDEDMTPEIILKAPSPDSWEHTDFTADDIDAELLNANALSDEEIIDFHIEANVKKPKKSRLDNRLDVKRGSPLLGTTEPTRQAVSSRLGPKVESRPLPIDEPLVEERRTIRHEEKQRAAIHRLGSRREPPPVSVRERRWEPVDSRRPVGGRVWRAPQRPMMKTHMDDESETRYRRPAGVDNPRGWDHDDRVPVSRDMWRGENVAPPSGRYGGSGDWKRGMKERSRSQREEERERERERRKQKEREVAKKRQRAARAREQEKLKRAVWRGSMVFVSDSEDSNVESATDEEAPPPIKEAPQPAKPKSKIKVESDDDDNFDL